MFKPEHEILEREDVLKEINESFSRLESSNGEMRYETPTIVIQGDPGYGKSQVARQYGEKYLNEHVLKGYHPFVFTLHAGDLSELYHSYKDLAATLLIKDSEIKRITGSLHEQLSSLIHLVSGKLSEIEYPGWLIIVDNLMNWKVNKEKENQSIFKYIPYYGNPDTSSWGKGRVLITTQYKGIFRDGIPSVKLQLSEASAIDLLLLVAGEEKPNDAKAMDVLKKVVAQVDCIPLALVSAAVYKSAMMKTRKDFTWKNYSDDLDRSVLSLKCRASSTYQQECYTEAVKMALTKLGENKVIQLAFLFVYQCNYKDIPLEFIEAFIAKKGESLPSWKLQGCLRKCQLISVHSLNKELTLIDLHQVSHRVLSDEVVKRWLPQSHASRNKVNLFPTMEVMAECYTINHKREDLLRLSLVGPHLCKLSEIGKKSLDRSKENIDSSLNNAYWRHLPEMYFIIVENSSFSPLPIEQLDNAMNDCLELAEDLSEVIPDLQRAHYLAEACDHKAHMCQYADARANGFKALEMAKSFKQAHPEDPKAAEEITYALQMLSWHFSPETDVGIATIKENLCYVEEAFGRNSQKYAQSLFQLAEHVKKRDRSEAEALFEQSLKILRGDPKGWRLKVCYSFYGRFLLGSNDFKDVLKAVDIFQTAIEINKELYQTETVGHSDVLTFQGWAYVDSFQPKEAIDNFEEALKKVLEVFHRKDNEWRIRLPLAKAYLMRGRPVQSLNHFIRSQELLEQNEDIFKINKDDRLLMKEALKVLPVIGYLVHLTNKEIRTLSKLLYYVLFLLTVAPLLRNFNLCK